MSGVVGVRIAWYVAGKNAKNMCGDLTLLIGVLNGKAKNVE